MTSRSGFESISGSSGEAIPVFSAIPEGAGPWPGVVVVHDALGMTEDLRRQARWLASAGFLAAAPDLFHRGGRIGCLIRTIRDMSRGADGPAFTDLARVRNWLTTHPRGTGRVGIVGFCLGGGFALMLAPRHGYDASAVNYGPAREVDFDRLGDACPIVASYGGNDPTGKGVAARLERLLSQAGIPHDVKEYPGVGHGFMNDHDSNDSPWILTMLGRFANTRYDPEASADAQRRIAAFFDVHLKGAGPEDSL